MCAWLKLLLSKISGAVDRFGADWKRMTTITATGAALYAHYDTVFSVVSFVVIKLFALTH